MLGMHIALGGSMWEWATAKHARPLRLHHPLVLLCKLMELDAHGDKCFLSPPLCKDFARDISSGWFSIHA